MAESKPASDSGSPSDPFLERFSDDLKALQPFIDKFRRGAINHDGTYRLLVRSSISKCYDFCTLLTSGQPVASEFYLVATLRGIAEDLIFLKALQVVQSELRDELLLKSGRIRWLENLALQHAFFSKNRPFQPILPPHRDQDSKLRTLTLEVQQLWSNIGCPIGGKMTKPTTKMLAQRAGLLELYEYIYSVASDMVHFNPMVLLRSGWETDESDVIEFSANHFRIYYQHFGIVYGTHLLTLYFTEFETLLATPDDVSKRVQSIRKSLTLIPRWPEIVTFEEMNIEPPDYRMSAFLATIFQASQDEKGDKSSPDSTEGKL